MSLLGRTRGGPAEVVAEVMLKHLMAQLSA